MHGIFSVDGKFYSITSKILDMILVTLMWFVGCIPVVTILTSTASMYQTTVKCIRYERGKVFDEFKDAYKKNLKQGIGLTLFFAAAGGVVAFFDYYVFVLSGSRTGMAFVRALGMLILTVVYLINLLWIVPVFSRFSNTFWKILQLNYVIAARHFLRSILMLLILAAAVILVLASNPLVILMPSLVLFLLSYFAEGGLHKYMPKQEEDNGDWRYGFK